MISFSSINIIAVFVATLVCMAIGYTWYSPKVFGTQWMRLTGISPDQSNKEEMKKALGIGFAATFINMFFIAMLLQIIGTTRVYEACIVAIVLWCATAFPGELHAVAWEKNPKQLFYINIGVSFLTFTIGASVIQWWPA